jgi:hypothetical protein
MRMIHAPNAETNTADLGSSETGSIKRRFNWGRRYKMTRPDETGLVHARFLGVF